MIGQNPRPRARHAANEELRYDFSHHIHLNHYSLCSVIDASHIDVKKRGMLDMKETLVPLVELLTRKELRERVRGAMYDVKTGRIEEVV